MTWGRAIFSLRDLLRHLPPTRALVGAALAFASYFVSTVWKGEVDDRVAAIKNHADRIAAIEARLNDLPLFQTYSHYWLELIELQREQIHIFNQTINKNDPEPFPVLELQKDDHRMRVFDTLKSITAELVKGLPKDFLALKPLEQDQGDFIFASNNWWRSNRTVVVQACFTELPPVEDIDSGVVYSKKLFALYKVNADKSRDLEGPYADFGAALLAQLKRLDISDATAHSIGDPRTLLFDKNKPETNPFLSETKSAEANFLARKKWAVSCLETAKEATFGIVSDFLRQLRSEIDTAFLAPLRRRRSMIGGLEIFLYVLSGMIALFGPARPSPQS